MKLTRLLTTAGTFGLLLFGLLLATPSPSLAEDAVAGAKRCNAYWHAHKADLHAQGKTRKTFMGPCMSGAWMFW